MAWSTKMPAVELLKILLFNEPILQYLNKSQSASVGAYKIQCLVEVQKLT